MPASTTTRAARFRRSALLACCLPLLAGIGACDPCFGTNACGGGRAISYLGEVRAWDSDTVVAGVRVGFVATGGAEPARDTLWTVSDSRGQFHLEGSIPEEGEVRGTLVVRPPAPGAGYEVPDVTLRTTTEGEVFWLGELVDRAYFRSRVRLYRRGDFVPLAGARVEVVRTGGIEVTPSSFVATTDADGWFWLELAPASGGDLVAELRIRLTSGREFTIRNRVFRPLTTRRAREDHFQGLGPSLAYDGGLYYEDTGQPAGAGVRVIFRRKSGLPTTPDPAQTLTDVYGHFPLGGLLVDPWTAGVVVGDIEIIPPAPYPAFVIPDVRLETYESDQRRILGRFPIPAPGS